jgi:Na+-transporting methylmalonyl-CoA/oxaloacetate decarboxylase gamma subunit
VPLTYGVYITAVGVAIVFAILIAIALASEAVRRLFPIEEPVGPESKLMKVAALAAACYYMGAEATPTPKRVVSEGRSIWAAAARIEGFDRRVSRDR